MKKLTKILGILFRLGARVFLVIVVLPILYLVEPFYRIRVGTMFTQRFAHLALNAEIFLRKMKLNGIPPRTRYLFFGYDPANRQLFEMWKRLEGFPVRFIESSWGSRIVFAWRPILLRTRFWEAKYSSYKEFSLFTKTDPILSFTPEEKEKGRQGLAEMGIGEDDWFVLFHTRDNAFLRTWCPELEDHWKKIEFRNSNIMNYLPAAEYVASLGGYPRIGVSFTVQKANEAEKDAFIEKWTPVVDCVRIGKLIENGQIQGLAVAEKRTPCSALYLTMPIHNDGTVSMCCMDAFRETNMGNVFEDGVRGVWHGPELTQMRHLHETGRIDEIPFCKGCNRLSSYQYTEEVVGDLLVRTSPEYIYYNRIDRMENWKGNQLGGHRVEPLAE